MRFPLPAQMDRREAEKRDEALIQEFTARLQQRERVPEYDALVKSFVGEPNLQALEKLERFLREHGTLDISTETRPWKDTDGEVREVTITRATKTTMWPMGTNYWVKDNVMIAYALIQAEQVELGRELLLSALTLMSSVAQLKRFRTVITNSDPAVWDSQNNWPHIFFEIEDNLNVARPVSWAHKQIAWQALACRTLELLERGLIAWEDLTEKHKQFLSMIVPFLAKIRFWEHENSSCWEEIPARRSSALAWDVATLRRLQRAAQDKRCAFLWQSEFAPNNFHQTCAALITQGLSALTRQLPFEAPLYEKESPRFREADALLLYLFMTDMPLTQEQEEQILAQVRRLEDPVSGGILRYHNDTYQRQGYFRNTVVYDLKQIMGAPSGNASGDAAFTSRTQLLSSGRQAAWVHPIWQLSWLMGKRYHETSQERYWHMQRAYFERGLKSVTGHHEVSLSEGEDGYFQVISLPSLRITEAYLTDVGSDGKEYIFPSPHTPLNWAIGEAIYAFAMMKKSLK